MLYLSECDLVYIWFGTKPFILQLHWTVIKTEASPNTVGYKKQPSVATHKNPDHFDQLPLVRTKFIQFRREGSSLLMITSQLKSNLDKNKLTTVLSNNICKKVGMRQKTKLTSLNFLLLKQLTSADLLKQTSATKIQLQSCLNLLKQFLTLPIP